MFAALEGPTSVRCAYVRASGDSIASASASQGGTIVVSLLFSRRCLELPLAWSYTKDPSQRVEKRAFVEFL